MSCVQTKCVKEKAIHGRTSRSGWPGHGWKSCVRRDRTWWVHCFLEPLSHSLSLSLLCVCVLVWFVLNCARQWSSPTCMWCVRTSCLKLRAAVRIIAVPGRSAVLVAIVDVCFGCSRINEYSYVRIHYSNKQPVALDMNTTHQSGPVSHTEGISYFIFISGRCTPSSSFVLSTQQRPARKFPGEAVCF